MLKKLLLFLLIVAVLVSLLVLYFIESWKIVVDRTSFPEYDGTILLWGRMNHIFDLRMGRDTTIVFQELSFAPTILCVGPGDTLLTMSFEEFVPDSVQRNVRSLRTGTVISKYVPFSDTVITVEPDLEPHYSVHDMDWDMETSTYIFNRFAQGSSRDPIRLSRDFNLIGPVSVVPAAVDSDELWAVWSLPNGKMLLNVHNDRVAVVDSQAAVEDTIAVGMNVLCVSPNRRRVLLMDPGRNDPDSFLIWPLDGSPSTTVQLDGRFRRVACFSPSGEQLALFKVAGGLLEDGYQLCVYDIARDSLWRTSMVSGWTKPIWLERRWPELFGL
ncbi:MAG: hypothetical protein KKA42_08175 [candidate division Zixibacteria bacterium]|nr:hypothetical protein [candidate division Zixibacteria bacterium]